jgi:hypothetical protein
MAIRKDLVILEQIFSGRQISLSGANAMHPRVTPGLGVNEGYCQVASCCKSGQVDARGSVHQIVDCKPPKLDAVSEELEVFAVDFS